MRTARTATVALASALLVVACGDSGPTDVELPPLVEVLTIREATAAGPQANAQVGIQGTVDAFLADLGTPNNGNAVGSQAMGRRQVTWDGSDSDAAPARMPKDFFNAVAPRGLIVEGDPRLQFMISADASNPANAAVEFGNVNATYPTAFSVYSSPRLFSALNNAEFDVTFRVPGTDTVAVVAGFGAVFTDVDLPATTSMTFYDRYDRELFSRSVLATPGNESLSFLGVAFESPAIARVHMVVGEAALGPNDVTQTAANPDIVVLDDFVYSEPVAVE
jgi:hypothetical protein